MDQELGIMINTLVTTHLPKMLDRIEELEGRVSDLDGKLAALLKIAEQPSRNTPKSKRKAQPVVQDEPTSQQAVLEEQPVGQAVMHDVQNVVQDADALLASITPQLAATYLDLVQNGYPADDIPALARYMQVDESVAQFLAARPIAWVSSYAAQVTI